MRAGAVLAHACVPRLVPRAKICLVSCRMRSSASHFVSRMARWPVFGSLRWTEETAHTNHLSRSSLIPRGILWRRHFPGLCLIMCSPANATMARHKNQYPRSALSRLMVMNAVDSGPFPLALFQNTGSLVLVSALPATTHNQEPIMSCS